MTGGESVIKKIPVHSALATRDALAKAIYGRIFTWIVTTINYSIHVDPATVRADIGVLDIFGFECFVLNSFEQVRSRTVLSMKSKSNQHDCSEL